MTASVASATNVFCVFHLRYIGQILISLVLYTLHCHTSAEKDAASAP